VKRKPPSDPNQAAKSVLAQITGEAPKTAPVKKDAAAVQLGRKGGLKGGPARTKKLTKEQLSEIGKKGAAARWGQPASNEVESGGESGFEVAGGAS
jgi:general stress protein YciG